MMEQMFEEFNFNVIITNQRGLKFSFLKDEHGKQTPRLHVLQKSVCVINTLVCV